MINCPICHRQAKKAAFVKNGTAYYNCTYCDTVFSEGLKQGGMIGGKFEQERNEQQNQLRIERFKEFFPERGIIHMDYGCGHGLLVEDCLKAGIHSTGYDRYNSDFFLSPIQRSPEQYDIISMVEVIEHLSFPFSELDEIFLLLKQGGILYVETNFMDIIKIEEPDFVHHYYIEPLAGHSTIFSHKAMDILMIHKGFSIWKEHINRNVRVFEKPTL